MEWSLTSTSKDLLKTFIEKLDSARSSKIETLLKRDSLSMEDMNLIKDNIGNDVPLFVLFNMLPTSCTKKEYTASKEFRVLTEKLRRKQENMQYRKLVESVDSTQQYGQVHHIQSFGAELKAVNRQLISVFNVLITVVGSFFFGFSGVTYAYPHLNLDLATRFLIGLVLATIVFFADLYFVIKSMEEPDEAREAYEESHALNFKGKVKKDS
ncbi:unnamed protein product [Auanema sp. JU1783]|nr:unnamed protein product [Auanema sp. JU1783]